MTETPGYILVVDDIPDILDLLDTTLKFKGYRVNTARNGQEALDAIQNEQPALVVADILMPKMDGFSLVHRLRLNPVTREIPVVFLSATYVAPEDKEFAIAIGVTSFVEKPVDIETFLPIISDILSKKKTSSAYRAITDFDFYDGYRKRLESKLHHKNSQISRSEHLLTTQPEAEKPTIAQALESAKSERDEILHLLDEIRDRLAEAKKSS